MPTIEVEIDDVYVSHKCVCGRVEKPIWVGKVEREIEISHEKLYETIIESATQNEVENFLKETLRHEWETLPANDFATLVFDLLEKGPWAKSPTHQGFYDRMLRGILK